MQNIEIQTAMALISQMTSYQMRLYYKAIDEDSENFDLEQSIWNKVEDLKIEYRQCYNGDAEVIKKAITVYAPFLKNHYATTPAPTEEESEKLYQRMLKHEMMVKDFIEDQKKQRE